jgi:photosystem II stability/assembly factor-like uncharacterized protein
MSGLLVSRDSGETWQQLSMPTSSPVNIIVQDPQRPAYIYVGTKTAFYSSHDGGEKWSRRGGDLPFGDFASILINPRNPDEVFTGNAYQNGATGGGVYRSTNAGSTWSRIDARELRLPSMGIWALALDPRDQNTFVGLIQPAFMWCHAAAKPLEFSSLDFREVLESKNLRSP